jgi:PEP-CTERM motif
MKRLMVLGSCVALSFATPALADVTYIGNFEGTVTSGSFQSYDPICGCPIFIDYAGQALNVSFFATVYDHFINFGGQDQPGYTVASGRAWNQNFDVGASGNNDLVFSNYSLANVGINHGSGTVFAFAADSGNLFSQFFNLSFSGAAAQPGPVTGSGNAGYSDFYSQPEQHLGVNFNLISGSLVIRDSAVPEPGTWALMICGVGIVGAAMRRRTVPAKLSARLSFA